MLLVKNYRFLLIHLWYASIVGRNMIFVLSQANAAVTLRWWSSNKAKPYNNVVYTNDLIIKTLIYQHEVI